MRKATYIYVLVFFLSALKGFSQDRMINNLDQAPQYINPSYYGFKDPLKLGLMSEFTSSLYGNVSQHQYAYATTFFEEYDFQLGLDYMSSKVVNGGYSNNKVNLSYVYKLQLENDWLFYPGVTAGYVTNRYDYGELVFSDQIDILTGQVNTMTTDPVLATDNIGYIDFGVSFMAHNDYNMSFGLAIKHINKPKLTTEIYDSVLNLGMLFSGQFAYEVNLNRYQQSRLPDYSYLYLFNVVTKQAETTRLDLHQNLVLSNLYIGLNEHISSLDGLNLFKLGVAAGIKIQSFDIGFNYSFNMGNSTQAVPSSFELFMAFDLSPFRIRNRKDFSRFY